MRVSIIVAVAENGVIGRGGALPWHLPDDLKRFKQLTMGHAVVMGRKTWESIGRPLPGRQMIVVTRQGDYQPEGVKVAGSVDDALAIARTAGDNECFIIGGAEVYRQTLPKADRIYLTIVLAEIEGDTYFPITSDPDSLLEKLRRNWVIVESHQHAVDSKHDYAYMFATLHRCEPKRPR
jgi:dihydrofolate reductase